MAVANALPLPVVENAFATAVGLPEPLEQPVYELPADEPLCEQLDTFQVEMAIAGADSIASPAAAKAAKELGYTNVKHLSAGISGWKDAGEKTEAKN